MHYFFDVVGEANRDDEGLDLYDVDAMKREAKARDLLSHVYDREDYEQFVLLITDQGGMCSVSFLACEATRP